jgi:hypothetical protein
METTIPPWQTIALSIAGILFLILIILTALNDKYRKRKPPQDHYYADRKDVENEDDLSM